MDGSLYELAAGKRLDQVDNQKKETRMVQDSEMSAPSYFAF